MGDRGSDPGAAHLDARETLYQEVLDAAPDPMFVVDGDAAIVLSNRQAERQFGYGRDELLGLPIATVIPSGYSERLVADRLVSEIHGAPMAMGTGLELTGLRRDGTPFPIEIMLSSRLLGTGLEVIIAVRDVSHRRSLEAGLRADQERAQVTLDSIGDAVGCTDMDGNITFLNLVAERLTGWASADAMGRPMAEVVRIVDSTSRELIPDLSLRAVSGDKVVHLPPDSVLVRRDGIEFPIEDSTAPIHDRAGLSTGAVIVFHDVSSARIRAQQLTRSAEHDFLTGLPNRFLLNDRIRQAIVAAPRHSSQVAILYVDLDGFKQINDSLGHETGDEVLKSVAGRLLGCVRASDTVSRLGGDEFIALLAEADRGVDGGLVASRMLEAISEVYAIGKHELHVTASIGISVYPEDGWDADTLIKNADMAMYQAKGNGRHGFRFFQPAMATRAVERQSIEEALRRAVDREQFTLAYQPKVDLKTGLLCGAEALIRWTPPGRTAVPPAELIRVAEEIGLIGRIGNWVLRTACGQARTWERAGLALGSVAVNVSAPELESEGFLEGVFAALSETGLAPARLQLELTETVLMKQVESSASILGQLRAAGVQVAVDDFGTGYSGLSYLHEFPIDVLKIDQSFIRLIAAPSDTDNIVKAIITMARSLNLRVVAEGVETAGQWSFLRANECDEAQGYLFGKPVTPDQFRDVLAHGTDLQAGATLH